jgi:glycosyltransferase involved in cell wall biosynthesis
MSYPKISIITPSYNQGSYLEETIQSVLSQNYPNLEFFILDGGSTDNSVEIIKKYEDKITFWRSHADAGQSAAIIEGFDRATGEIIAWLNSDDQYEPGALHQVAKAFQENKDAAFVYGDYYVVRQDGTKVLKRKVSCDFNVMAYAYLMIPQPSSFWKKSAYEAVGGLDTNLRYVMDYDLFLKLAKLYPAKRFIHLKTPLSAFRLHPESKSVKSMAAFSSENRFVVDRVTRPRKQWHMRLLRYAYLLKLEWMYLTERGYLPLRKDRSKA